MQQTLYRGFFILKRFHAAHVVRAVTMAASAAGPVDRLQRRRVGNANAFGGLGVDHDSGLAGHDEDIVAAATTAQYVQHGAGRDAHVDDTLTGFGIGDDLQHQNVLAAQAIVERARFALALNAFMADAENIERMHEHAKIRLLGAFDLKGFDLRIEKFLDRAALDAEHVVVMGVGVQMFVG